MSAPPKSSSASEWASQAAWAVSGIVLALIVFAAAAFFICNIALRAVVLGLARGAPGWPHAYLQWELALLDDLGHGLDLSACAVSGVPNVGAPEFISIDVTNVPAMTGAPGRTSWE